MIVAVARPHPHPHRDPLLGHGQPDDDLGQVRTGVLGVAVAAQPAVALLGVTFEVRARREQEQVDFEVEQVRGGEEHRLLHLPFHVGVDQNVHRPVRLILIHLRQAGDGDVG
jgi:hypothetical protein